MPRLRPGRALAALLLACVPLHAQQARPNVLWITSEDNGPHLGCYGDDFADTPHLDGLAARGMVFLHAWSNAPVCAPARTAIISGVYPTSSGAQHMRSSVRLPDGMGMFPQLLRDAGYYCCNRAKEDYNLVKPGQVWDVSSGKGHWRGRQDGQPFFAVWNITVSHESQIRKRPHQPVHDQVKVRVPAYHPDHPTVRRDSARSYDKLTEMDARVGRVLGQLEDDGLGDETIVFYFGDHGPGMPRNKRSAHDSGLRVPLIVSFPERFRHLAPEGYAAGGRGDRLVSFVDLAPTVLSLAGIETPAHYQGGAFCGPFTAAEPATLHGFRGRMDERYDLVRSVRDERYVYLRNYLPHRIPGEHVAYMFQTPTTRIWQQLQARGELTEAQSRFWRRKDPEELYDLTADPDEVHNLAESPAHRAILERMRAANREHVLRVRDLGFLPEDEMHRLSTERTPYETARDDDAYPLEEILAAAEHASIRSDPDTPAEAEPAHPALRYWNATGLLVRGRAAVRAADLRPWLADPSPTVRVAAAEALARHGRPDDASAARRVLLAAANLGNERLFVVLQALAAIDALDARVREDAEALRHLPRKHPSVPARFANYVPRLLDKILADLDGPR